MPESVADWVSEWILHAISLCYETRKMSVFQGITP
jgi:hypothetical protein